MTEELLRELELEKRALEVLETDILSRTKWNKKQLDWINGKWRRRCLSGANQIGKSTPLVAIIAMHLTGRYPKWYKGPRFTKPPRIAVAGVSHTSTRELVVDRLLGRQGERGTGYIPLSDIDEGDIKYVVGGKRGQIDEALIQWHDADGRPAGKSRMIAFSYAQGFARVQGQTLDLVAVDECPPLWVLDELFQRTNFTRGYLYLVMSPQDENASEVADRFEEGDPSLYHITYYGVDDADHLSDEHKNEIKSANEGSFLYECRVNGRPAVVSGRIFKTAPEVYVQPKKHIEGPAIIGIDFPHTTGAFAACKIINDGGVWVVVEEWKKRNTIPSECANAVLGMGGGSVPVAGPHDGGRSVGDGTTTAELYRKMGINMLPEPAFMIGVDGNKHNSTLSIIEEVTHMLATGKLKIAENCAMLQREMVKFRFKRDTNQKPKNQDDHITDAMFKALMMRRFAQGGSTKARDEGWQALSEWAGPSYDFFNRRRRHRGWPT